MEGEIEIMGCCLRRLWGCWQNKDIIVTTCYFTLVLGRWAAWFIGERVCSIENICWIFVEERNLSHVWNWNMVIITNINICVSLISSFINLSFKQCFFKFSIWHGLFGQMKGKFYEMTFAISFGILKTLWHVINHCQPTIQAVQISFDLLYECIFMSCYITDMFIIAVPIPKMCAQTTYHCML